MLVVPFFLRSRIILSTGSRADCTLAGQYGPILMRPCNDTDHGKLQIGESGLCFLSCIAPGSGTRQGALGLTDCFPLPGGGLLYVAIGPGTASRWQSRGQLSTSLCQMLGEHPVCL